jgi:HPt (histidine-containing phosphotransfer) domain-containing protein
MVTSIERPGADAAVWSLTAELKEIAEAESNIMPELVCLFLDDSALRLQSLSGACVRQDFKAVRAQAHSLKGSSLQMGAAGLASLCSALELSDRPGPDLCGPMLQAIGAEFVRVRGEMEQYLTGADVTGSALPPRAGR